MELYQNNSPARIAQRRTDDHFQAALEPAGGFCFGKQLLTTAHELYHGIVVY